MPIYINTEPVQGINEVEKIKQKRHFILNDTISHQKVLSNWRHINLFLNV